MGFWIAVGVFVAGFATILVFAINSQGEYRDRCADMGGVAVITKGDDVCIDRSVILDER